MEKQTDKEETHQLRELCPSLTPVELDKAEDNLREYVALAVRVYERIRSDPTEYNRFHALTAQDKEDTIQLQEELPNEPTPLS